ncbi:hypothetical protein CRG98_015101 [Punica granatum]|uniref:Uncharacterized protein n=1 Tax=Punica granatum TaxID=22663 RepID=A0A2I0K7L9_PUNGR|nr:hypothetical protein CRG98_015101 [Punica granatum]
MGSNQRFCLAHVAGCDLKLGGGSYQREGAAKAGTTADFDPRLLGIHRHSTPELVPLIARPGHPQRNSRLSARPVLDKSKTSGLRMTPSSNKRSGLSGLAPLTSKQPPKTGLQAPGGPPRSWDKLRTTIWNSTGLPEGRFSGSKRLPMNLRSTFTENRDHSDPPNTPGHSGNTEKIPVTSPKAFPGQRSSVEDNEPTISHEVEGSPKQTLTCTKSNRGPGTLNSTPNVRAWQNRFSKRRVARTFVHTTYGDVRLIQIHLVQAFQIYKLIGLRRPDARSIKSQTISGFSLNRTGSTAQPSRTIKPRLNPKPWLKPTALT